MPLQSAIYCYAGQVAGTPTPPLEQGGRKQPFLAKTLNSMYVCDIPQGVDKSLNPVRLVSGCNLVQCLVKCLRTPTL